MRVVLAIDDSPYSETVVEAVCNRRWPSDTEFRVLTVMEPAAYECQCECETRTMAGQIKKKRHAYLEKLCNEIRHRIEQAVPTSIVHFEVQDGDPKTCIITDAVDWDADRILVGAHGRNVCPRNLPGSVSRYVANHAHCSVEIIQEPQRVSERELSALPA